VLKPVEAIPAKTHDFAGFTYAIKLLRKFEQAYLVLDYLLFVGHLTSFQSILVDYQNVRLSFD
jgi:hypothetical protein